MHEGGWQDPFVGRKKTAEFSQAERKMMMNCVPPSGRYYSGALMADGRLIPAGHPDGVPFDGDHLLIEVAEDSLYWSLNSVGDDASHACSGRARVEESNAGNMVLVLDEPFGSGGSCLLPFFPLNPEVAAAYLAGLMTGLPNWPFEVRLPDSLRSRGQLQPA